MSGDGGGGGVVKGMGGAVMGRGSIIRQQMGLNEAE